MSLFNLTDVKFTKSDNRTFEPLSMQNYEHNLLRYPIDLGNADKGHYMMIHINRQEKTAYNYNDISTDPTIISDRKRIAQRFGTATAVGNTDQNINWLNNVVNDPEVSYRSLVGDSTWNQLVNFKNSISGAGVKVSEFANAISPEFVQTLENIGGAFADFGKQLKNGINDTTFLRRIKRTTDSIALYMPNTLAYTHQQEYSEISLGGEFLPGATAALSVLRDSINNSSGIRGTASNISPFILELARRRGILSSLGQNTVQAVLANTIGGVTNPHLEVLYSSPKLRNFQFDFMFYPRSEVEAREVMSIIERLNFHQAPEVMQGTAGFFMVPPSEFDIEFYYNGKINPNIPKITTCVLTSLQTDYAPNGYHAYEVPGRNEPEFGGTGTPVGIRLTMNFMETRVMTKMDFEEKYYNGRFTSSTKGTSDTPAI